MSDLRSLFPSSSFIPESELISYQEINVYNASTSTASNGGACCLFTVPENAGFITFEMWGGGGGGAGSTSCQMPLRSGSSGGYGRVTVPATAGETYTICAGGSTACTTSCEGCSGFVSYVIGGSGAGEVNACAAGGLGGKNCTTVGFDGTTRSCGGCVFDDSFSGVDFGLPRVALGYIGATCGRFAAQFVPQGPYIGGGARVSRNYCCIGSGSVQIGGDASFPGGAGGSATTSTGTCWGSPGAGGLVKIRFK